MDKIPMTVEGEKLLREELSLLKTVNRPQISEAIKEAREKGDLKENAEYHAAREQQSFVEGRIKDIEGKLSNAQIIDISRMPVSEKVIFGTTVVVADENNKKITYKIVGEDEADLKKGKISVTSPISRALVGKNEGDDVTIKTPSGDIQYEIIEVKYV
ncbi:MAG: transcription elongation factor GreA [Gammaproteobacteria bacterium]|nr:transcription elongation factor GreA [Gammaproteobacteria bacterium]MBL6818933.1 transcription elongation factor GreA [Gammaproteobacteria bacterium]MBL6898706.1 transcription elongation factor GreA [Gammaproteobacteria bacterium]